MLVGQKWLPAPKVAAVLNLLSLNRLRIAKKTGLENGKFCSFYVSCADLLRLARMSEVGRAWVCKVFSWKMLEDLGRLRVKIQ